MADVKLCECGCGEPAPIAKKANRTYGHVAGQPVRFVRGHYAKKPLELRLAAKLVPATDLSPNGMAGCLLWTGTTTRKGYGQIDVDGKMRPVHRVAWTLAGLAMPSDKPQLDHLCRRRACAYVPHLEPVTNAENQQRAITTRLTPALVREIRTLAAQGWLQRDIAAAYGVCQRTVSLIHRRETWTNV